MAEPCENCDTPELMVILYSARIENNQLATIFRHFYSGRKYRDRAKRGYFLTRKGGTLQLQKGVLLQKIKTSSNNNQWWLVGRIGSVGIDLMMFPNSTLSCQKKTEMWFNKKLKPSSKEREKNESKTDN